MQFGICAYYGHNLFIIQEIRVPVIKKNPQNYDYLKIDSIDFDNIFFK